MRFRAQVRRLETLEFEADNLQHALAIARHHCDAQKFNASDYPLVHDALKMKTLLLGVVPFVEQPVLPKRAA